MTIYERIDRNKAALDARRPLEGDALRQLREYYRIGLTWTSNALEGNSLTEVETKVLLEDGLTVGGKPLRDTLEAVGHSRAYDHMFSLLGAHRVGVEDAKLMHRLFYREIDEPRAGVWRDRAVFISGTDQVFPAPSELEERMRGLEDWMAAERGGMHPVRFAAMLHLKFVMIHPFIDGNGRVARLLMNTALLQEGYLLAIVPPILRREYLSALRVAGQGGSEEPFCTFIAERVLESEKEIMRLLHIS